jgi:hypothetical protein
MVIEYRLPRIEALRGRYRPLDRAEVTADVQHIRRLLPPVGDAMEAIDQRDFSDADESEAIAWLSELGIGGAVRVLWPAWKDGVSMAFADFASNYSDLWYPDSDNVWVVPDGIDWVLELFHEEVFSLYRPRRRPTSSGRMLLTKKEADT